MVEELAARAALHCRVTPISEAQLRAADEVWISAATREVQPVTSLDARPVGAGQPGPLWRRIYQELQNYKRTRGIAEQPTDMEMEFRTFVGNLNRDGKTRSREELQALFKEFLQWRDRQGANTRTR